MNNVKLIKDYIGKEDWRIKENSNSTYSQSGLMQYIGNTAIANYMLKEVYPEKIANLHTGGWFHIHDLGYGNTLYCCGWSLEDLIREGFNGVIGKTQSAPAKHLNTLCLQMINFLGSVQMECAGAQAFNSVDLFLAPFVKIDNLSYKEVKQCIQQLIFNLNVPSRWGAQAPFSNFTFDLTVPKDKENQKALVGGKFVDFTYGECKKEIDMINRAFLEVMMEGDAFGAIFSFPVSTYNITKDFDYDSDIANLLWEATAKYGLPYFSNFVNSDMNPEDVRSMCCRLRLDVSKLEKRHGGLFGSGDKTGSIGVVTLNLPRIGYIAQTKEAYFILLDELIKCAIESLNIKREVVKENFDRGLMPFTKRYLGHINNHFSTIGIIGMNESLINFFDKDLMTKEGQEFAAEILDHINNELTKYQEQYPKIMYNLEATPAEGTSYRLAKIDLEKYGNNIYTAGTEENPYYTNSVHLPVSATDNFFDVLDIQDNLQTKFTSGTVIHCFIGERINSETVKSIVKKVCYNYKLPYFSITPTFSICQEHGYLSGEHYTCPTCGKDCLIYSRIVGYYSPINNWNKGKSREYIERKVYKV